MKNGTYEVRVHDGRNEDVLKMKKLESGRNPFEGKTDGEIRQMVKEENKEDNLQDSDIQIIREDGKVKVKVVKELEK